LLLLRRVVAGLRGAGWEVGLLAPSFAGSALLGRGAADVERLVPWEQADVAALLVSGIPPADRLQLELARFDLALAYTRSGELLRGLGSLIPRVIAHDPSPAVGHASDWLASPLVQLGVASAPPPSCSPEPHELAAGAPLAALLPDGFLAIHPGSGSAVKNWPAERFAAIAARRSDGRPWLLIEGPADAAAAETLARAPGAVRARELAPRVLGALLSRAGAYLGNDSGISHLAAAWGAPTLSLFGPTDPAVWAPLGPRSRALRSPSGTLEGLSVDAVESGLAELARCAGRALPSG
jgi:hypothetical protein